LSPDPIGIGDGLNVYCYVSGDPVNFHDPRGTMKKIFQKIKAGFNKCFGGGMRNNNADGVGNEVTAMPQSQIDKERYKRSKKGMSA
jgi:uncharacterized protein RhaS with RHS repeats